MLAFLFKNLKVDVFMNHSKIKNFIRVGFVLVLKLFLIKDCIDEENLYL